MSVIINETIQTGDRFRGLVNGETLRVTEIREPGLYHTEYGYQEEIRQTKVYFVSEETGRKAKVDFNWAKNLLLQRI